MANNIPIQPTFQLIIKIMFYLITGFKNRILITIKNDKLHQKF